ncbi:L,D-transpeptidase [Baaleninema simplex]|uniref:L,D-transpeptidase n=1 Tax=Baaleninema simplex TaxID=2862350 RepID=UPI000347701F|nr:L,D-transpeptidase [Baaleninema simplex]
MTVGRNRTWLSRSLGTIGSSVAVLFAVSQGAAMASQDSMAYRMQDPSLQLPPLGAPEEFLPPEEVIPEGELDRPTAPQNKPVARIELNLSERRVYVYLDDKVETSYPVAIGKPGWETPVGEFQVMHMAVDPTWENPWTGELIPPGPSSPIGRAVIVFHELGDDWVAFHGTPNEELIGQAVSHGCVRMRNEDILAMYEKVNPGTPVVVVP